MVLEQLLSGQLNSRGRYTSVHMNERELVVLAKLENLSSL